MEFIMRLEADRDHYLSELVAQRAFWNKHHPGCDEHYLVHKLRSTAEFVPELTYVAERDGRIIGLIMYAHAYLLLGDRKIDVLTFGPLCVEPDNQGCGVGGRLLDESLRVAKNQGHKAVVIYGEPDYYPRHGFFTCDKWGITTPDGSNYSAFMGRELVPGGLDYPGAKFFEPDVYSPKSLPPDEVDKFSMKFPYMEKKRLPGQWPD